MEIISSGIITVPAGVSSTGLYFIQEGVLQVVDKGWAQEIGLAEGGQAFVSSGGILYLCTVSSGGTVTVLSGGYAQDVTVENGGLYLVSSGGTAHKSLLKSGGTQIVRAGEMAASVTVLEGGVLHVSSGGYARNPVVSSGGFAYAWANALIDNAKVSGTLEVNANAAANSVSVLDGGKLAVLTGGYAYEAKISSGGTLDIASGGRANFTKIYESGTVMVSAGASCNNAEINGGEVMLMGEVVPDDSDAETIPGGFASNTTVNSGGFLFISSGGVANSTTVNSRGSMYVSSGGVANSTTVNSGGYLDVSSGGVASCAIVSEWGMMAVNKDGLADGTTVESDGRLYVSNGGTVSNATVESAGILYVSRGGTASGATVNSGGSMFVSSGGTATGLAADSGACLNFYVAPGTYIAGTYNGSDFVIEDGAVSDYTVNGNVKLFVSSGCTADVITVNSKGELRIRGGAAANGVTVNGGDLYVQNSGTATDIVWTPCEGHVYVYAGGYATFVNEYSGVYFGSGNKLLSSASPMDGKTLDADFEMYVMGGGAADNTTVNSGGMLYVQNGGAADHATVNSGGSMYISSGGIADSAAVNEGGRLYVSAGGTATGAAVNSGGSMYISSGGTAAGATVNSSGELIVYSGGTATGAAVNSDGNLKVYFGGTADHAAVNEGGRLYVSADGTATGAAVNSDGELIVYSDGTAAGATVNDEGCLYVSAGGTATGVTVNSGGSMYISSGGTAAGATVNSKGLIYVCNGGIATNILENGGYVYVGIDEDVTFLPNTIKDLVLEKASATLHSGTTASIATVNKDGRLQVRGGLVDRVTLNDGGDMFVGSGGTAADITVYAGGRLELGFGGTIQSAAISSGGIVTGHVDCQGITFDPSAVLQFDLSVISPGNESALVNLAGLAEMPDCPSFTLLVSDSQNYGDYKLAENAWGFETKTISVSNSVMEFGALSLDRSVVVGSRKYTLNLNDGDLILSVNAAQPTQYVYLDFDGEDLVRYNNSDLELSFDLSVADPAFSDEQRAAVVSALSERYGKYNIAFALERPEDIEYSTLYFGVSSAFDEYGDFFGISETCDGNDQVRDDNAFVLVNSGYSDDQIITVASHMLDRLMGFSWSGSVDGSPAILKYAESKALLSLSAGWNQKDPYNKYCPIDPNTGDRCVVGCTNTAASQIIYYWIENGLLDFTLTLMDSDAYQSNDYIMIESSDDPESGHLSFAETNKLLQSFNILDENCIAALCFAAGVFQQADYASDETATPWNEDLFIRAGFEKDEAAESIANDDGSSYYDILVHELLHGRPVGVSFLRQDHAIVADGYDSSRNMFHLDLGWGNDSNRWYTVEEMEDLSIYVDISGFTPAVSPDLTIEDMSAEKDPVEWKEDVTLTFTVSNDGKEMSEETMAYVYCGDAVLVACGIAYISPGYSRDFICTVNTASLKVGENILTVKVGSQNDEGTVSSATCEVTVVDTTAPVITLTGDTGSACLQTTLTAEVDDGSQIYYRISEFGSWKKYTEPIIASLNETYYFKATDEAGNTGTNQITFGNIDTTGVMLSTLWAQSGVCPMGGNTTIQYNEYTPYDPTVTPDTHSKTGCSNTAVGQLLYYFIEKQGLDLALTLDKTDEYTYSHKGEGDKPIIIEIKSDGSTPGTLSFAAINELLANFKLDSAEHAAALVYACGVVQKSKYSASSTGTSWKRPVFTRSGLTSVILDGPFFENYWGGPDDEYKYHISDAGFEVLIENLEAGRPVGASFPGHALVIDGYDRESDTFHINYGWGYNQATRWYTREEMFEEQFNEFVYDLRTDYVETFTVTDARVYGTGTMIRAFEKAAGMIGDNTVAFDPSVAGKTVELQDMIMLREETAVSGFNMNVLVVNAFIQSMPSYGFYAYEDDSTLTFHASEGSLVVSTSNEYNHAFNLSKASSGTVDAGNMLIYGGKYSAGAAVVLEALQVARSENTDVPDDLLDPNGWSYFGSAGNDVFSLSNLSIAVGNVSLDTGNDVLSLRGHSRLYGTIDAGDGDDSITVDSTSSISGDLSGKSKLNFVLTEREDHAMFTVKTSVSDLYANTTLSVDMSDAVIGIYTLVSTASGATGIADLQNMVFTVTGSGCPDFTLSVNGTSTSDFADLIYEDNSLKLKIKAESGSIVAPQTQIWAKVEGATQYIVEYSMDNFGHVIQVAANTNSLDSFQMPAGKYQVRVKADDGEWTVLEPVVAGKVTEKQKLVRSNADGNADVFFVNAVGTWKKSYAAQHVGSADDPWGGTKENVMLVGKNKLTDVFEGSDDANTLLMTDDANGDALFVDDIYSALPGPVAAQQSRIARIDEIRAGAGNDIVDMTSNKFKYTGDGLTIRGGDGDDVIWANKGGNLLFGDAGNDRIVGASGNDVIAGGIGDDSMHGGGGNDVYTFCDNWGTDEVEQLAGGTVTLWFVEGSLDNWDEAAQTYTDGDNSVTVKGVNSVELKFGSGTTPDDAAQFAALSDLGAFDEFTSRKIFEDSGKGILAGQ